MAYTMLRSSSFFCASLATIAVSFWFCAIRSNTAFVTAEPSSPLLGNFTRILFHLLQCHLTPADSISHRHTVVQRILRIGEISCKFSVPAFFSLMSAMCPAQKRDCNQVFTIK